MTGPSLQKQEKQAGEDWWYSFEAFGLCISMSSLFLSKFSGCCGDTEQKNSFKNASQWWRLLLGPYPHNTPQCSGLYTCQRTATRRGTHNEGDHLSKVAQSSNQGNCCAWRRKKENFCPEEPCWVTGLYSETRYIPAPHSSLHQGSSSCRSAEALGEAPNWVFNVSDVYRSRWRDPFKSSIPKCCENPKEAMTRFFSHCPC